MRERGGYIPLEANREDRFGRTGVKIHRQILRGDKHLKGGKGRCRKVEPEVLVAAGSVYSVCNGGWIEIWWQKVNKDLGSVG